MALPTELRLKKLSDFEKLRTPKAVFPSGYLILKCAEAGDGSKFGFAVSKRLAGSVLRNRIRRILSEWVRSNVEEFPDGYLWLIILRKLPEPMSVLSQTLRDDIQKLARKASSEL
jgi:ribonuclease P protein component